MDFCDNKRKIRFGVGDKVVVRCRDFPLHPVGSELEIVEINRSLVMTLGPRPYMRLSCGRFRSLVESGKMRLVKTTASEGVRPSGSRQYVAKLATPDSYQVKDFRSSYHIAKVCNRCLGKARRMSKAKFAHLFDAVDRMPDDGKIEF